MSRHRHVSLLIAALAATAAVALALASGAGALCAPVLGSCSDSATPSAPTAEIQPSTDVTPTSATLHGLVDPDGLATTYAFAYAPARGLAVQATPPVTLPASFTAQSVSVQISGLLPASAYVIALVAHNTQGESEATGDLDTPAESATLDVSRPAARSTTVRAGTAVTITDRVGGPVALYTREYGSPRARLVSKPSLPALSLASLAHTSVSSGGVARFLPVVPSRNTRFQVRLGGQRSRWLTVFVEPVVELYSARVGGDPGRVQLAYTAGGGVRPEARGPVAYFYAARSPRGPFRRIGAARMDRSGYQLQATLTAGAPPGAFLLACTRVRIIPSMGRVFHDHSCGRARLR